MDEYAGRGFQGFGELGDAAVVGDAEEFGVVFSAAPFALSSCCTPPVSFLTMPPFHAWSFSTSSRGSPKVSPWTSASHQ